MKFIGPMTNPDDDIDLGKTHQQKLEENIYGRVYSGLKNKLNSQTKPKSKDAKPVSNYKYYTEEQYKLGAASAQTLSLADQGCKVCKWIKDEGKNVLYKDSLCAIIRNREASNPLRSLIVVPLRHIRNINHLRPRLDTTNLGDGGRIRIIINPLNHLADINLVAHMRQTAAQFMRTSQLNNQPWSKYNQNLFGFPRPPLAKLDHLAMKITNIEEEPGEPQKSVNAVIYATPLDVIGSLIEKVPKDRISYEEQ